MEESLLTPQMRKNMELIKSLKDKEETYVNGCYYLLKSISEEKNRVKKQMSKLAQFYLRQSMRLGKREAENLLIAFWGVPDKCVWDKAMECLNAYIWSIKEDSYSALKI